jgi:hypothetical protein
MLVAEDARGARERKPESGFAVNAHRSPNTRHAAVPANDLPESAERNGKVVAATLFKVDDKSALIAMTVIPVRTGKRRRNLEMAATYSHPYRPTRLSVFERNPVARSRHDASCDAGLRRLQKTPTPPSPPQQRIPHRHLAAPTWFIVKTWFQLEFPASIDEKSTFHLSECWLLKCVTLSLRPAYVQ